MPVVPAPDVGVGQTADAGVRPETGTDAHVRNEELLNAIHLLLEEEEGAVAVLAEPLLVGLHEGDDLVLRQDELVQVDARASVDVLELTVTDELVDFHVGCRRRNARNV